jgi:methionine-gamma-lyase
MRHLNTLAVHAGREDFDFLRVHAPPLDLSTTYPVADLASGTTSFDALVAGEAVAPNPIYARLHNPTVARTERAIASLEGTQSCVAFASGMAALTAVLLAARERGTHVLAVRPLYGTSDHLLASGLAWKPNSSMRRILPEACAQIRPSSSWRHRPIRPWAWSTWRP